MLQDSGIGKVKSKKGSQFDSYAELDSFELEDYRILKKMCDKYGIEFLSTPFDEESVDILLKVGIKALKSLHVI